MLLFDMGSSHSMLARTSYPSRCLLSSPGFADLTPTQLGTLVVAIAALRIARPARGRESCPFTQLPFEYVTVEARRTAPRSGLMIFLSTGSQEVPTNLRGAQDTGSGVAGVVTLVHFPLFHCSQCH